MNVEYLKKAHERVPSVPVLVNLISKRVRQLINGDKPLLRPLSAFEDKVDTALREVAEGKLIAQIDFDAINRDDEAKKRWAPNVSAKTILDFD
jgi:DNA-directed RNA polymerase subunit K/omega